MSPKRVPAFRARTLRHTALLVAIGAVAGLGIAMYTNERDVRQEVHRVGNTRAPDRVDVTATIVHLNPTAGELELRVVVRPRGKLVEDPADPTEPTKALVLESYADVQETLRYAAHERISSRVVKVSMNKGTVTDYPFDRYTSEIVFSVKAGGKDVPLSMTLQDTDAFFSPKLKLADAAGSTAGFEVQIRRSRTTFILTTFMMITMWAIALAVLNATWTLINQGKGLVWPALGWMAATLFAMAGFRGIAPGSPPMGSVFDYAAFLWAEAIIALSLVSAVAAGVTTERAKAEASQG